MCIYLSIFILGLLFGSFFNVVGLRIPIGKSVISPRSSCSNCGHYLSAQELIPIFSFLFQKGKCRSCGILISKMYIFIELLTGSLFVLALYEVGFHKQLIIAISLVSLFIIIVVSDISYMIIPNRVLLVFLFIFIVERIYIPIDSWWSTIAGSLGVFFCLLIVSKISKGGMGGGDIKLMSVLGIALGWKLTLVTFMLACFSGSIFGIAFILAGKLNKHNPVPFGPFIAFGGLVSYFYSDSLLEFYVSILG